MKKIRTMWRLHCCQGVLLIVAGSLFTAGCCPYTQGINFEVSASTPSSADRVFGYALGYLSGIGYRIWQEDKDSGYIRCSIKRDTNSLGLNVEDVLAVSIVETTRGAKAQITAETYELGSRRIKIKVSEEVRKDASALKENLRKSGTVDSVGP